MQPDKETVLKAVKENRWNIQSFNGRPIFLSAAARSGWYVGKALGSGYRHFFYLLSKTRISMYYDEEDWRRIGEAYYASVSDVNGLSALIERYEREYREHTPAAREPLRDLSPAALIAWVQAVAAQLDYSVGFAHGIEGITFVSEARLRTLLEKRGVMSEMLLSKLSSPTHVSFLSRVRRELWDIHGAPANEKLALAKRFLASYAWIENTYLGSARLSPGQIVRRSEDVKSFEDFSELDAVRAEKEELMRTHAFTAAERFVVETIDLCFKWQDDRKRHILEATETMDEAIRALARKCGIDFTLLSCAVPIELTPENLGSAAFLRELSSRRDGCALYETPEGSYFYSGDAFAYFTEGLHAEFGNGVREVRGQPASEGVATGIARVCESVSDIAKVQEGEILVASMTRPEYLLAMQKAAAFVTNEGGVTCHAAIIAREMKKPCVIGTKIATRVIKDGDTVEVDAMKGVVTILESRQ